MHLMIPVKRFADAKSRLAGRLSPSQRASLARAMLEDVLAQVAGMAGVDRVVVVSDEPALAALTAGTEIDVVAEAPSVVGTRDLNAILERALDELSTRGVRRVLMLHADLPLLERSELSEVIARGAAEDADLVVIPDRTGQGTNGLIGSLPRRFGLRFGPGSLRAHHDEAAARGLSIRTDHHSSLALDVDTDADLAEVLRRAHEEPHLASRRTIALLRSWNLA